MVERRLPRRIMKDFVIGEISAVDTPAQSHARAVIMKRGKDVLDKGYYDASVPCSPAMLVQEVEAMDFNDVLAEQQAYEVTQRVKDCVWSKWSALQRSFDTIAADEDVAAADKVAQMQASLRQFLAAVRAESAEIAQAITKSLSAAPALAELLPEDYGKGDDAMTEAEKKQMEDLQKSLNDQLAKAETTSAELKKMGEDLAKAQADLAEATAKAGMSDEEKSYAETLDKDGKHKFMGMSPEDRKKLMKVQKDADPVVYKSESTGEEFRKSDDPRLVKMAQQADEDRKIAKAEREAREQAEFAKRAEEEPYKHFAGESADKVAVVRAVAKLADDKARETLEKMLAAGGKAIAAAFDKIGHKSEHVAKTAADFNKRVDEIAARESLPRHKAMEKARELYPEEFQAFNSN